MSQSLSRRTFFTIAGSAVATIALNTACRRSWANLPNDGRIARPRHTGTPSATLAVGKAISLGLDRERDAILYVPQSANAPVPLLMFLHGATQSADDMAWYLEKAPDETGVAILAPNSRDTTWDAINDGFGTDVQFINDALERTFKTVAIDPERIILGGFSDGATYAISLGLINGDFCKRVVAFSPGFVVEGTPQGRPQFFISHGTRDHILPIDRCGRRIARDLQSRGYEVTFREFDGDHEIPNEVLADALQWIKN